MCSKVRLCAESWSVCSDVRAGRTVCRKVRSKKTNRVVGACVVRLEIGACVGRFGARVATFGEFTVFAESVQQNVCPAGQRVYSILRFAPPLLVKIYVNDSIDQMAKWPK